MRQGAVHAVWLLLVLLTGCGGGGSDASNGSGNPPGGGGTSSRPDIVLVMVSGHQGVFDTSPSQSYLQFDAGPEITTDLANRGQTVTTAYFVDDALQVGAYRGYYALVSYLQYARDNWVPLGSRVVLVAYSHGGVWAHAAVRTVSSLSITCLVDLDCSSYGWSTVGHDAQNSAIGGDPRGVYDIGFIVNPSAYPAVPSEETGVYDLEDTVFANVIYDLDVRSGASPLGGEWFDEVWNIRLSATTTGLYYYYSGTSHTEVHAAGGATLSYVRSWLRARLGV